MQAILQRGPFGESSGCDLVGARGHPSLPPQERHEDVTLDERSHRAIQQRLPRCAGQERRDELRGVAGGLRHGRPRRDRRNGPLDPEDEVAVRTERQEVVVAADARKLGFAEQLDGDQPGVRREVERRRLRIARQVADDEERVLRVAAQKGEHLAIRARHELDTAPAQYRVPLAQANQPFHPVQRRERIPLLRFHVDRLEAVDRIHDRRRVQARRIRPGEAGVAIAAPLHRRADPVAIAEIDVVAHHQLVAVIDDGRAGQREEQDVHQLHAAATVVHQRCQTPPDPDVQAHHRIRGVRLIHVVALFVGDHFERQLVMIPKEQRPLAVRRNLRRLPQDVGEGMAILLANGHEDPGHQRKVERHVAFVAVAKVRTNVGRPLIRLAEQHGMRKALIDRAPDLFQDLVCLGQVLVARALPHAQVGHRIETQRIDARLEPEGHDLDDGVHDLRVVVIEIGLVREEAMPVVLARDRVIGPVRRFCVGKDDPRLGKRFVSVAPDVEVPLARSARRAARRLEPGVLIGRVVDHELDQYVDASSVCRLDEGLEVRERAVARMDVPIVRDVVPVVFERRGKERQQPETGNAQVLQIVQLARQPVEITDSVIVAVEERSDVRLVDDGVFEPERVVAERHGCSTG